MSAHDDNIRDILRDAGADDLAALSDMDVALLAQLGARVLEILRDPDPPRASTQELLEWTDDTISLVRDAARSLGLLGEEARRG